MSEISLEQSFNAIEKSSDPDERCLATVSYVRRLREHVEGLAKLGISVRVQAGARSRLAAVKGLVFNNEVFSICTTVAVEIETLSTKQSTKEADEASEREKQAFASVEEQDSVSEKELNPTEGNEFLYIHLMYIHCLF